MGVSQWAKVLSLVGHTERSEAQLDDGGRVWNESLDHKLQVDEHKSKRWRHTAVRASNYLQTANEQGLCGVNPVVVKRRNMSLT